MRQCRHRHTGGERAGHGAASAMRGRSALAAGSGKTALVCGFILVLLQLLAVPAAAQDEPEYRLELGAGLGLMAYQGDFGGSVLKQMQPLGSLEAKYKPNPRSAWAVQLGFGHLKGQSDGIDTWYPATSEGNTAAFSTSVVNFDVRYEYNFWAFGTGKEYRGARPLTPFIAVGMGLTFASAKLTPQTGDPTKASPVGLQMPIGFGVKYKVAQRVNLVAEWMMHFTGTDKLDACRDPYGIESSGLFKNTDCYSSLQLSLTYDLWAKCKTCHNDDE